MKTVRRSALLGLLGAMTTTAFSGSALARGGRRARFSSGGAARHGAAAHAGPVMSREQLGSCLADQTAIEQKSGALEQAMASLSEDRIRLAEIETAQKRFNGQCASQAYDEADMQALLAKR